MEDEYYCQAFTVYEPEEPEECAVIYDHNGNPYIKERLKMGFDLTINN